MYLAKNIRYLRKKHNMSQEQLADVFGYNNFTTIQKWETEKSVPPFAAVKGLADLFKVSIDDLTNTDLETVALRVNPPTGYTLSSDEIELLRGFRKASADTRLAMLTMARAALNTTTPLSDTQQTQRSA